MVFSSILGSTPSDVLLTKANNELGQRLFRIGLAAKYPNESCLMSPLSIYLCLLMVTNGTVNQTHSELLKALQIENLQELNNTVKELLQSIPIHIANSVWITPELKPHPKYVEGLAHYFNATVASFTSIHDINQWCSQKTNGKVPTILTQNIPDVKIVLVNAVYFKGIWENPFPKYKTRVEEFYSGAGVKSKCQMMCLEAGCSGLEYIENKSMCYQAIKLPYKRGEHDNHLDAVVILPENQLACSSIDIQSVLAQFKGSRKHGGTLKLPKFILESKHDLKPMLKSVGIQTLFEQTKDMDPMVANKLFLDLYASDVIHKTFIEVNEEGAVAAAVTAVSTGFGASAPVASFNMVCNRPFFFLICHRDTIVFQGYIMEPKNPDDFTVFDTQLTNNSASGVFGSSLFQQNPWGTPEAPSIFGPSKQQQTPFNTTKIPSFSSPTFGTAPVSTKPLSFTTGMTPTPLFGRPYSKPPSFRTTWTSTTSSVVGKSLLSSSTPTCVASVPAQEGNPFHSGPLTSTTKNAHPLFRMPAPSSFPDFPTSASTTMQIGYKLPQTVQDKYKKLALPSACIRATLCDILNTDGLTILSKASGKIAGDHHVSADLARESSVLLEQAFWIMTFCANKWQQEFGEPFDSAFYNLACIQCLLVELEIRKLSPTVTANVESLIHLPIIKDVDTAAISSAKLMFLDVPPRSTNEEFQTVGRYLKARLTASKKCLRVALLCGSFTEEYTMKDRDLKALRDFGML